MEAFEREILRYEHASGEGVSDALRIGLVLRQLEETKLKEYLLTNASKLTVWKDFQAEVNTIKRTQANIGALPMDLDAFSKGRSKGAWEKGKGKGKDGKDAKGKGKRSCFLCGSPDHMQAQCPKGTGKGGKGKGTGKGKTQCHKCW
eukprot:2725810-Amphidinium_carterae.1